MRGCEAIYIDLFAVVLIAVREIASIDLESNRRIVLVAVVNKSTDRIRSVMLLFIFCPEKH